MSEIPTRNLPLRNSRRCAEGGVPPNKSRNFAYELAVGIYNTALTRQPHWSCACEMLRRNDLSSWTEETFEWRTFLASSAES
jgi:hypothetical protein